MYSRDVLERCTRPNNPAKNSFLHFAYVSLIPFASRAPSKKSAAEACEGAAKPRKIHIPGDDSCMHGEVSYDKNQFITYF